MISIDVGVQMFIQLRNLKSRLLTIVIAAILSPGLHGCTHLSQVESLAGKSRTEIYRTWVREDQNAQRLLVFVHGFNSSKDLAWGKFPELVVRDSAFDDFNILLFGYPTKFCGEINDLRRLGEFLGSFLKDELSKYKSVQMVGHSMGGLVIQHALLSIESSRFTLLKETVIELQAFGTPFYGVEGSDLLRLLCENKQADDLTVLNKELGRLQKDWAQRFNRYQEQADDRVPTRISLYHFYGLEDHFVREASACGGAPVNCDAVDGDHISMVKPENKEHLAYRKVRALAKDLVRRSLRTLSTSKLEAPKQLLVIEGVDDSLTIVPQGNRNCSEKVAKLATLKLKNVGGVRITNVGIAVLKTNDFVGLDQPQLPVSSMDILFDCPNPPPTQVSVVLNPGDEAFFGAVIECNGKKCPRGKLGVPYVNNGAISFLLPVLDNIERFDKFTVRASGDMTGATIKTFHVLRTTDGSIELKEKMDQQQGP
ncbi:MAG: alpha/beta fold hydrolase [Nitrospiraceae bacterium]